jgi:hypothetical protein
MNYLQHFCHFFCLNPPRLPHCRLYTAALSLGLSLSTAAITGVGTKAQGEGGLGTDHQALRLLSIAGPDRRRRARCDTGPQILHVTPGSGGAGDCSAHGARQCPCAPSSVAEA